MTKERVPNGNSEESLSRCRSAAAGHDADVSSVLSNRALTALLCCMPVAVGFALLDWSLPFRASSLSAWLVTARSSRQPHDLQSLLAFIAWLHLAPLPIAHLLLRHASWSRPLRIALVLLSILLQVRITYSRYVEWNAEWLGQQADTAFESALSVEYANFALSIVCLFSSARMLEWALVRSYKLNDARGAWRGGLVRGMEDLGPLAISVETDNGDDSSQLPSAKFDAEPKEALPYYFPGSRIPLELALCMSFRGLGWTWGLQSPAGRPALAIAAQLRSREKGKRKGEGDAEVTKRKWRAIARMLLNSALLLVLLDVCDSCIKSKYLGASDGAQGASIWSYRRGPLGLLGPYIISVMFALVVLIPMQIGYNLALAAQLTVCDPWDASLVLCNWHPNAYTRPHTATSLRAFWTTRWHALFRRVFLFFGYRPASELSRRLGLGHSVRRVLATLAVFLLSGLLHEVGQEGMAHGHDANRDAHLYGFGAKGYAATRFFLLQGLGCLAESLWEQAEDAGARKSVTRKFMNLSFKIEGRRTRAVLGWLWTFGFMTATSTVMTDTWCIMGTGTTLMSFRLTARLVRQFCTIIAGYSGAK